jgi:hypothetical protein
MSALDVPASISHAHKNCTNSNLSGVGLGFGSSGNLIQIIFTNAFIS